MAQALGSVFLNPISTSPGNPQVHPWSYITVAGRRSPGAIPVDGITGFEREFGWDVKEGKGTQGATLTLQGAPLSKGSITFQLWTSEHFVEWRSFVLESLKYNPKNVNKQALSIYHPSLADIDINAVVTAKISPIRGTPSRLYVVTVDFIEWMAPPKKSIVKTPPGATANDNSKSPGIPPDPVSAANQATIADRMIQAGFSAPAHPGVPTR